MFISTVSAYHNPEREYYSAMILRVRLVDDCWSIKDKRDPDTGRIMPDLDKFPSGIKGVADKVHDLGLKIGIYSSTFLATLPQSKYVN